MIPENPNSSELRESLDSSITSSHYKTVNREVADWISYQIGRLTRNQASRPYWHSLCVVTALIILLGFLVTVALKRVWPDLRSISLFVFSTAYIFCLQLAVEAYIRSTFSSLHNFFLSRLDSAGDLEDIASWLRDTFDRRRQLAFGITFTLLVHLGFVSLDLSLFDRFGFGLVAANVLLNFFHGICVYFAFAYLLWLFTRLRNYQFDLFAADPSSTETIMHLATTLTYGFYIAVGFATAMTVFFSLSNILPQASIVVTLISIWVYTITLFVANQFILSSIIVRAKWKALNKIQSQIHELESSERILSETTLGHIGKLIDYHQRIKETRNSALDVRALINVVNSLLLPTLSILATNSRPFVEFLKTIGKFLSQLVGA